MILPIYFIYMMTDSLLRSTAFSTCSKYSVRSSTNSQADIVSYRPRQSISAICIPLSVMLAPILACRLILDLRERGSETVAHSTGTIAFTAGVTSSKSSPDSPFPGFGFGLGGVQSRLGSSHRALVRGNGVVLSTMGSIPADGMASGLEMNDMDALDCRKDDLECGYGDDIGIVSAVSGIRVEVEKTTM